VFGCGSARVARDVSPGRVAAAAKLALRTNDVEVPLPRPTIENDFIVIFDGIIAHLNFGGSRRAVPVTGNLFSMRHEPRLYVTNVVITSLRDAAGNIVHCEGKEGDSDRRCWVNMNGLHARIVDSDGNNPSPSPLTEDPSFTALIPHLASRPALNDEDPQLPPARPHGALLARLMTDVVPDGPAAAYFDVADAGTLIACPFTNHQGRYVSSQGAHEWAQFADLVYWSGKTAKRAMLQIKSSATYWNWTFVERTGTGPLIVDVWNHPPDPNAPETTTHFVLNEKLMPNAHLSVIEKNDEPCRLLICYICRTAQNDVPGCSDTGWP